MEILWQFVLDNFGMVATIVLMVVGVVLGGKRLAWFQWANETLFLAFDAAEKKGLLEGIKGADKLSYYLGVWRDAYMKKYGTEPPEQAVNFAVKKAGELSQKEKVIRLSDPKS